MEWQPIETAPKDRTEILIWDSHGQGYYEVVVWGKEFRDWVVLCDPEVRVISPTHWMPLPEPPQ